MTTVGVVTAAWGSYGRFLCEWAESLAAQDVPPDRAVIVDGGVDDRTAALDAGKLLRAAGIDATVSRPATFSGMGEAMNAAVSRCRTEFVMRVDADDTLLPETVADVHRLADGADVVVLGALRHGEPVLFENTSTEWILSGRQGSMSPSAFRREFWERAPYIEANDWVESAFWVGLAHQGARFVPTMRPGFVYRQWDGSHSALISRGDKRAARRQHLALCRRWDPPK